MKKRPYLLETLIGFAVLDIVNLLFFRYDLGFVHSAIHPYWFMIVLIAVRYGLFPGIFVSAVASAQFILLYFGRIPGSLEIEKMIEAGHLVMPFLFMLGGIFMGAVRQQLIDNESEGASRRNELEAELKALRSKYDAEVKARKILEARIVGESTTITTLADVSLKLFTSSHADIFKTCLQILCDHFDIHKISLYLVENDYLVLKETVGWTKQELVEGRVHIKKSIMKIPLARKKAMNIKEMLADPESHAFMSQYGLLLASFPILDVEGKAIGLVNIENMDFLSYQSQNLRLIGMVVNMMSKALIQRRMQDSLIYHSIWDKELGVHSCTFFAFIMAREFLRARAYRLKLCVTCFKIESFQFLPHDAQVIALKALVAMLKKFCAPDDAVFRAEYDGIVMVVSPFKNAEDIAGFIKAVRDEFSATLTDGTKKSPLTLAVGSANIEDEDGGYQAMAQRALRTCGASGMAAGTYEHPI